MSGRVIDLVVGLENTDDVDRFEGEPLGFVDRVGAAEHLFFYLREANPDAVVST